MDLEHQFQLLGMIANAKVQTTKVRLESIKNVKNILSDKQYEMIKSNMQNI